MYLENDDLKSLRDSMHLTFKEWQSLGAYLKVYKDREYEVLEPGWSDQVYQLIWTHFKLLCPFSFKNAKINQNEGAVF